MPGAIVKIAKRGDGVRPAAFHLIRDHGPIDFPGLIPLAGGKGFLQRVEHARRVQMVFRDDEGQTERAIDSRGRRPGISPTAHKDALERRGRCFDFALTELQARQHSIGVGRLPRS